MSDALPAVPALPTGGHDLPARLASSPDSAAGLPAGAAKASGQPRRLGRILLPVGAAIAVLAITGGVQLSASLGYDDAESELETAAHAQETAAAALQGSIDDATLAADAAARVIAENSGSVLGADELEPLAAGDAALRTDLTDAGILATASAPTAGAKPFWPWELFGAADALRERAGEAERTTTDMGATARALDDAAEEVEDTGSALFAAAAEKVPGLEAAALSARNERILELRTAGEELVAAADFFGPDSAQAFIDLDAAAFAAAVSHRDELATKSGPLQETRLEIEAFARELAPGVLMDFTWSTLVNGLGTDGWLSGQAWWRYDRGGYASLELSDSVAEQWPSQSTRSLVAHEVGHAITVKCQGLYDDTDQAQIEEWATAWAYSMGFTDEANGTSAYGAPSQSMIDLAATCR